MQGASNALGSLPVANISSLQVSFGISFGSKIASPLCRRQPALEAEAAVDLSL